MTTVRRGREKLHFLNAAPINAIADRWINHYDRQRAEALADLKTALEHTPMTTTSTADQTTEFVYTTYIKTTPEQLWQALTDAAFTRRYWGVELTSDWQCRFDDHLGVQGRHDGRSDANRARRRCESPPRLQLAHDHSRVRALIGSSPDEVAALAAERRSNVSFEIEPMGELVKLTVTHGGFEPGSTDSRRHLGGMADDPRQSQDAPGDRRAAGVRVTERVR